MDRATRVNASVNALTLFATTSTLVCCAIPMFLVTLGMGAAVAAVTADFPVLIALSLYKAYLFAVSGLLLALSGWLSYRPQSCPADPVVRASCERVKLISRRLLWGSAAVWGIGFFAAYVALPLRLAMGV